MNEILEKSAFLTVPGWNGSGPGHWQSIWEDQHRNFRRVQQRNWSRPARREWIDAIQRHVVESPEPPFLVAHSLGCLAVAAWAAEHDSSRVRGALLVAPPWISDSESCPRELTEFLPMPTRQLPFPSILAASENDPYLPLELAVRLARGWGSEFFNAGRQGHINTASGHGAWSAGKRLLETLAAERSEN
jgi:predicted alpha/beta hydrolase family esterase